MRCGGRLILMLRMLHGRAVVVESGEDEILTGSLDVYLYFELHVYIYPKYTNMLFNSLISVQNIQDVICCQILILR